jgi:WD40 repeat protein
VVTWSVDNNGRIWDAATGIQVATFTLPGGAYLTPIYSPDGQRILTVNGSETYVRVWDASTGESRGVIAVQNSKIVALAFSADGQRIVTLSADGRARIFDAAGRAQLAEIRVQPNVTDFNSDVAFSPDGRRLLVSGLGLVLVIDSATGATGLQIRAFDKESYPVVEFSPDGRFIIAANQPDGKARIWDVSTGGQVRELSSSAKILHAAFSPDGRRISTADHGGHIGVWDAATGAQLASMEAQGVVSGAIFSPDGRRLLTLSADHTARIWDSADGDERLRIAGGYAASLSPDGRRILTTAWIDGGGARVWDAASGALRVTLAGVNYPQLPAVFLPGGRRIYAVDEKGASAGVWDALTGRLLGAAPVAASGNTFRAFAAVSPNGRLALRQVSDFFEIRDLQTGGLVRTLPSSTSDLPLAAAAFSPDSTRLAIGLGSIGRVWETTGRRLPIALLGHEDWTLDTVFSPDGRRITTASRDHTARIWDATNGRPLLVLRGHTGPIDSVRYSADGRRLLTAGRDGSARIWDASSGALLRVLSANSGSAPIVDFSPDAGRVATTAGDNSLRLWDADSGAELADLRGHTDQIQTVAFSPDGRDVLTSSEDGSARLWDIANIPDLPDQLLWARAAQFEPLSDVDRARLGLRRSPSPQDQVRALFDRMRDPAALARQAEAAQRGAISETNEAQKNARLLTAFEGYAAATAAAEARGVPEETRRPWRYRRASLARILARAGKMREVAEAYGHIVGR